MSLILNMDGSKVENAPGYRPCQKPETSCVASNWGKPGRLPLGVKRSYTYLQEQLCCVVVRKSILWQQKINCRHLREAIQFCQSHPLLTGKGGRGNIHQDKTWTSAACINAPAEPACINLWVIERALQLIGSSLTLLL